MNVFSSGGHLKKIGCFLIFFLFIAFNVHAKDYIIGGGDALNISVWGSSELSVAATVRPDGKISIPALGEIKASGFTPAELTAILEKEMKKVVKTPIVTVIVTAMTNYNIFVFGKGAVPGVYPLSRETTLLEFLSQLGSLVNADRFWRSL
jgi:polysaccharide export outer membrane protein